MEPVDAEIDPHTHRALEKADTNTHFLKSTNTIFEAVYQGWVPLQTRSAPTNGGGKTRIRSAAHGPGFGPFSPFVQALEQSLGVKVLSIFIKHGGQREMCARTFGLPGGLEGLPPIGIPAASPGRKGI